MLCTLAASLLPAPSRYNYVQCVCLWSQGGDSYVIFLPFSVSFSSCIDTASSYRFDLFFFLLQVGDTVTAHVDYERRAYIAANHTMTHQVNQALRATLVGNGKVYLFV